LKKEEVSKFIIFESSILDDLNHRQAILMGLLNGMAKKEGYAYLKNATICELLKASESTVKSDLKTLEELKYIKREVIRNDKKEVIQRRIYPMVKFYTEGGVKSYTEGRGEIYTIDKDKYINIIDKEYRDAFARWIQYKKEIKDMYKSELSLKTLATKIMKNVSAKQFDEVVDISISNGWKGLFFDKVKKDLPSNKPPKATLDD
jgi:DNA-binding Lrp family transcriptional regulator